MGASGGPADPDVSVRRLDLVLEKLHEEPCLFQFFQAVRLLERIEQA